MPSKSVNVGLIGYAFMGKAHSNALKDVAFFFPELKLQPVRKAICGRTESAVKEAAGRFGWESYETDWRKLVRRPDIDVVDIVSPGNAHVDHVIGAAEAGKHIICEKPMATTLADAKRMVAAVEKAGVRNMVMYNYRRVPAIAFARQLVKAGEIGEVYHFRAFYLQAFDHAPVESAIDGWQVLAWKQGMHFLTARLRPCRSTGGACTEGTLSESDLSAAGDHPRAPEVPSGSVLATDLEMNDAGRRTRMLAWHEEASPTWAAARLVRQLSSQGLTLERRTPSPRPGLRGESLWFGGRGREAIATILAGTEGTTVTLQTTIHPGHGR